MLKSSLTGAGCAGSWLGKDTYVKIGIFGMGRCPLAHCLEATVG